MAAQTRSRNASSSIDCSSNSCPSLAEPATASRRRPTRSASASVQLAPPARATLRATSRASAIRIVATATQRSSSSASAGPPTACQAASASVLASSRPPSKRGPLPSTQRFTKCFLKWNTGSCASSLSRAASTSASTPKSVAKNAPTAGANRTTSALTSASTSAPGSSRQRRRSSSPVASRSPSHDSKRVSSRANPSGRCRSAQVKPSIPNTSSLRWLASSIKFASIALIGPRSSPVGTIHTSDESTISHHDMPAAGRAVKHADEVRTERRRASAGASRRTATVKFASLFRGRAASRLTSSRNLLASRP